jgi:hypothetical protein
MKGILKKPELDKNLIESNHSIKTIKLGQTTKHTNKFIDKDPKKTKFVSWKESEKGSSQNVIICLKNRNPNIVINKDKDKDNYNSKDKYKDEYEDVYKDEYKDDDDNIKVLDSGRKLLKFSNMRMQHSSKDNIGSIVTRFSSKTSNVFTGFSGLSNLSEQDAKDETSSQSITNVLKKESTKTNKTNGCDGGIHFIKRISIKMVSKYEKMLDIHYIDSSNNVPEYYEDYIVQNLKVIKNMQFFFNECSYDELFCNINKKVLDEIKLDYDKPYLIFDLDETLIHSELIQDKPKSFYDRTFKSKMKMQNSEECEVDIGIMIRPGAYEFLDWTKQYFQLGLMTAAEMDYANNVIKTCEMEKYFDFVFDRDYCIPLKGFYIKDMSIFNSNYAKLKVLLIDNNIFSFANSLQQGVLISSFYYDKEDTEFKEMKNYFEEKILNTDDICENMININNNYYMYQELMSNLNQDSDEDDDLDSN